MNPRILEKVERARRTMRSRVPRGKRSKIGQFFTPTPIARFMASLFERCPEKVRILDPGAGTGVLFAALVSEFCSREQCPRSIDVVAYENNEAVTGALGDTMSLCGSACEEAGVAFKGAILREDFVSGAVCEARQRLFGSRHGRFTHAILNPPYKKISSRTKTRRLLDSVGMETSNLYAAFVWLAVELLQPEGELVAITPRSFCNGPYFRRFRKTLLKQLSIRKIHTFESRKKAFADDAVLQENIIFHGVREVPKSSSVQISTSEGAGFKDVSARAVPFEKVVLPQDTDAFIHLAEDEESDALMEAMKAFKTTLNDLGIDVSTGRVVDFRAREYLRERPSVDTAPLIYPGHFEDGFLQWPRHKGKKPNAIVCSEDTEHLLVQSGYYVLTKRFTAKEERRRVVAAVFDPKRVDAALLGFENHLNYFHARGAGMAPQLAKGLAVYLNSTQLDRYFRLFSGHTQVNATDLRKMFYPSRSELLRLGCHIKARMPDQEGVDAIVAKECDNDG